MYNLTGLAGYYPNIARSGNRFLYIYNMLLDVKVHVIWNLKGLGGGEPGDGGLEVSPLETEIPAGGSMPFQVGLSASKGNCYFAEEAEAFVSPKNQRTFRYGLSIIPQSGALQT